jgi:hypothetical protein
VASDCSTEYGITPYRRRQGNIKIISDVRFTDSEYGGNDHGVLRGNITDLT